MVNKEVTEEEILKLRQEASMGAKARQALNLFIENYCESRKIQLLSEYMNTPVDNSKKLFEIKYRLDALNFMLSDVNFIVAAGEAAAITIKDLESNEE